MINITDKSKCCGCGSCAKICPKSAISMVLDGAGFLFPKAEKEKCIDCGMCDNHCPVLNHKNEYNSFHTVYAAYAKDDRTRYNGSSGGMFGLLAESIIERSGIVYGAAFDDKLKLRCIGVDSAENLYPLYKSKYLQSDVTPAFDEIKENLDNGKEVLFISTPCQVYALSLFLKKKYANLYLVDFVCHGVPSQSFFDKCKSYDEKRYGGEIVDFQFRAKKKNGATPHYFRVKYYNGTSIKEKTMLYTKSTFYYGFQRYITLRDSCYDCHFSHSNRCSDITIGDFHSIDKYVKGINRFDGVSTVCINSEKGKFLWNTVSDKVVLNEVDFEELYKDGELMAGGTVKPKDRDEFVYALETQQFEDVVKKYIDGSKEYTKSFYYLMPAFVRKVMKKMMRI